MTIIGYVKIVVIAVATLVSGQNLTIEAPKEVEPMDWVNVACNFSGVKKHTEAVLYQDGHKLENVSKGSHLPDHDPFALHWSFNITLAQKELTTTLQCKDVNSIMESDIVKVSVRLRPVLNISSPLKVHSRSSLDVTCHLSSKLPLYDVIVILLQDGQKVETEPERSAPNKTGKDPYILEFHFNITTPDVPGSMKLQCFMEQRNISSNSFQVEILQDSAGESSSYMDTEAKIGVGVGIGVGIPLVIGVLFLVYCMRKKKMCCSNDSAPTVPESLPLAESP